MNTFILPKLPTPTFSATIHRKQIPLIAVLGAVTALGPLSIDMYLPAFVSIAKDFSVTPSQVELSLTTFFLGLAVSQLIYGPLSDRYGRSSPLYFGLGVYMVMSLACSLSTHIESLIVFRFLQALGAGAGIVIARATVRDLFQTQESARIFSFLMLILGLAPIFAPTLGNFLCSGLHWRAIFFCQALFGGACVIGSVFVLPKSAHLTTNTLKNAWKSYFQILGNRSFISFSLCGALAQAGMFAYITDASLVLMELFHFSRQEFGYLFGCNALGLILGSQLNAYLLRSHAITKIFNRGLRVLGLSAIGVGLAGALNLGPVAILPALFIYLMALGSVAPNAAALALGNQSLPSGSASALLGSIQFTLACGISVFISRLHQATLLPPIWPMSLCIAICGCLSGIIERAVGCKDSPAPLL